MKEVFGKIWLAAFLLAFPLAAFSQDLEAARKTRKIIDQVIADSYPELKTAKIEIKTFQSKSNYFKSQFSIPRFLTFRPITYIIYVNPEIYRRTAPADGVRAILAHELAHILYYRRKNRFELLGLAGLTSKSFTAQFERKTDLEAIARGYGEGLRVFREWLYQNIPPKALEAKKRDYFSPEEIDLMLRILRQNPKMLDVWRKKVPRNLESLKSQENSSRFQVPSSKLSVTDV